VPLYLFFVVFGYISVLSFRRSVSTIPVLGLLTCLYMMSQLGLKTWTWFLTWLAIGLLIYFNFGIKNSKLNKAKHN
nr:hypothetical protein [Saprospiraceae bacterium]